MGYALNETPLSLKYQAIYLAAEKENEAIQCFTGVDKEYRITTRDSYYSDISDMDSVLELCIYPLYEKGNTEIKDRLQKIIEEMANSDDVLQIFQVFNLIMAQDIAIKLNSSIPFEIDFSTIMETLLQKKATLEEEMKNYQDNGFDRFRESIWDCIERICKKSKLLKEYINK